MKKQLITTIIRKFLEGHCSDEEFAYLLYWYESFDEQDLPILNEEEKEELRIRILSRVRNNIPELNHTPQKKNRLHKLNKNRKGSKLWKYAAAAVIIGIICWGGFRFIGNTGGNPPKTIKDHLIVIDNRTNRIHPMLLPDSSKIWLTPGSSIKYPEKFPPEKRMVRLTGEVFFEIKKEADHPFIVKSNRLTARVLGTSFLIQDNENGQADITVISGKVAVTKKNGGSKKIILEAKQKAAINKESKLIKEPKSNESTIQRWQKASLSFDNVPFKQVTQALKKKFDIRIFCREENLLQYKLNANFNNQNLVDILNMLEMSLNIHYKMANDSTIIFYTH